LPREASHPRQEDKLVAVYIPRTIGLQPTATVQLTRCVVDALAAHRERDVAVVSKMIGHSTVTLTQNTYRHAFEKAERAAADAMEAALG
jgi:hypothetical protein